MADDYISLMNSMADNRAGTSGNAAVGTSDTAINPSANTQIPQPTQLPQPTAQPQAQDMQAAPAPQEEDHISLMNSLSGNSGASSASAAAPMADQNYEGSFKNPINQTPVTAVDRLKLSLGNDKGKLAFLKGKFEDAQLSEKDGLLVMKDGTWHKVDPDGMGQYFKDPWELTRDIADLADVGLNMVGMTAGAGIGTATGGPGLGTVGGAGIGGAVAAQARTSLGRYVGTYDATPGEQIKDITLEGILSMGGEYVGTAMKPGVDMLTSAVGSVAKRASEPVKDLAAKVWASTTGTMESTWQTALQKTGQYAAKWNQITKRAAGTKGIIEEGKTEAMDSGSAFLKVSADALPQKYGQLLEGMANQAGVQKVKVNPQEILASTAQSVEENGMGRFVPTKSGVQFKPLSPTEIASRYQQGLPAEVIQNDVVKEINKQLEAITPFASINELKGPAAVKTLTQMNKMVNRITTDAIDSGRLDPSAVRVLSKVTEGFRNSVSDQFEKIGLGEEYGAMQNLYSKYGNAVAWARQQKASMQGPEMLVKKLLESKAGKNMAVKNTVGLLRDLAGEEGEKHFSNMELAHAVADSARIMPDWSVPMKSGATVAGTIGASHAGNLGLIGGMKAAAVGLPLATQFSPRLVGAQIRAVGQGTKALADPLVNYGFNSLQFLKSLGTKEMTQLLQDPRAFAQIFQIPGEAAQQEQQAVPQLLQQTGVIPNGQQ